MSQQRRRSGATPRSPQHQSHPRRRLDWATFDRWLDRVVLLAVVTALVVGGAALVISLVL